MFPYLQIPLLRVGSCHIAPFRALLVTAILVGYFTMLRQARRAGLDGGRAAALCVWAILAGILGAHWFKLVYQPQILRIDPWWAVQFFNGMASFGGIAGGLVGGAVFFRLQRMPASEVWRYLDVLAYAFLCGWVFGRLGCYVVHDHPGIPTTSWLGVRYPGGPRYDLGLLEVLVTPFFIGLFRVVRRFRLPGLYVGVVMVLYPSVRLWIDTLHEHPPRYWGVSVDQYASFACILTGLAILRLAAMKKPAPVAAARVDCGQSVPATRQQRSEQ